MENLSCILEEAATIVDDDHYYNHSNNFCFHNNIMNNFNLPNAIPAPLEALSLEFSPKPIAHKAFKTQKKRTWKKPLDKPKRPLSAYNLFFKEERERILASISDDKGTVDLNDGLTEEIRRRRHRKTHGKIGFADLARSIADQWKQIDDSSRSVFETQANIEKARYKKELDIWMKTRKDDEVKVAKKVKPAIIQSVPQLLSLSSMMSPSSIRTQLLHQHLMMQHQALMSQQKMEPMIGLPQMIQKQQEHIMMMNQNQSYHASMSMPLSMHSLSAGIPQNVQFSLTSKEQNDVTGVSYPSKEFFDDEPLAMMEHQSVVTEESDLSSLEDDLTNFMNDFEAEL